MNLRPFVLAFAAFAALAPNAVAGIPPGDDPPGGDNDSNKNHVHELKPWKARFEYKVVRDSSIYPELNRRSGQIAQVIKGQWWRIDCQLSNVTQNGPVLWNHIPNVGWIADHNMKTYTDGRIAGSPTCADPTGNHVWFKQAWAAGKEYRATRTVPIRTRPAGAKRAGEQVANETWRTIDCGTNVRGRTWVRLYLAPRVGEGWIPADALRFWQKGLPAGLPHCGGGSVSKHIVTLGDSYAAGIGAGSYYAESGSCYRSYKAYWALLEQQLASGFVSQLTDFEACSGDTTDDLLGKLGALDRDTALVTISIGGNDMKFSSIVKACVYPAFKSCQQAVDEQFTGPKLRALEDKLDNVYRAVRAKAPNALVLVLGYPEVVPRDHVDGCGALSDGDAPTLHRAATLLNNVIDGTVGERPRFRFIGLVKTFLGHPACNRDAADWINGISNRAEHLASFHPNESGNLAIAARIKAAVPRFFRR